MLQLQPSPDGLPGCQTLGCMYQQFGCGLWAFESGLAREVADLGLGSAADQTGKQADQDGNQMDEWEAMHGAVLGSVSACDRNVRSRFPMPGEPRWLMMPATSLVHIIQRPGAMRCDVGAVK